MNARITSSRHTHNHWTLQGRAARPSPAKGADVVALFERWNQALQSGQAATVADLYSHDAVLLPTVADEAHVGRVAIRKYFEKFLQSRPQGVVNERFSDSDGEMAVDMGTYTFALLDGKKVAARYTFVYRRVGTQWLISHHHSSVMPEQFCQI